jgi:putative SbcD/Mre11-related phosphoesterase
MTTTPELADRAAYFPGADALVLADLHLGRDAKSNVALPMGEGGRLCERVEELLAAYDPATVVLAGDVLHAFDSVPEGVDEALSAIEDAVAAAGAELVHVAGNHDGMLDAVASASVTEAFDLGTGTVVLHGDEAPETLAGDDSTVANANRYVVGHEHPAIVIEGQRHACYLEGPAPDGAASVFVLPAFNRLARGTVVNGARNGDAASPLLAELRRFRPAVLDPEAGETLWFPPLSDLQPLL